MGWDAVRKARRRLSREQGTVIKDWGGRLPIALIYPNSYYVGMSCLGVHAIYHLLNSYRTVVCERVFREREDQLSKLPPLSLESQRPLADFAVLAFSVNYEVDYLNVVQILKASGIPLLAAERSENHPLVMAGGPCVTANPLPLAPFFDVLCLGEAEPILPGLLSRLSEGMGGSGCLRRWPRCRGATCRSSLRVSRRFGSGLRTWMSSPPSPAYLPGIPSWGIYFWSRWGGGAAGDVPSVW